MGKIKLKKEPKLDAKYEAIKYQAQALREIRDKEYSGIFHEQGLGKTKIAIDLILYWLDKKIIDTILLIVKKGLIKNWLDELKMHSFIKPRILSQNTSANFHVFNSPARLILTHYEIVKKEASRLALFLKTREIAVILDESTKIKNPNSILTKEFIKLSPLFKKRVIMTGTPIANRPYDIWAQINFLDQGDALGNSFSGFKRNLDLTSSLSGNNEDQSNYESNLTKLWPKISDFCVRETKKTACIELPKKTIETIYTDWEMKQFDLYEQVRKSLRAIVVKEGLLREDNSEDILKRLLRLVQIASNPALIDESYKNEPGKLEYLRDIVQTILSNNEKCIIWTSFTENVDMLYKVFRHHGSCRVHGKLPHELRNKSIESFKSNDQNKVLIATPGAAKEGLTLTIANHAIFYDRTFSLDDYLQSQDRIHRISQKKHCYVYNLMMINSIDEWIDILLNAKRLSAELAQGDISSNYYKSQMSYEFGEVLRNILEIN